MGSLRAYPRKIWMLAATGILYATGMAFIWPMVTIYIHDVLGKSLSVAGMLLVFNQGGFLTGSLVGGLLFDRWGKLRTIVATTVLGAVVAIIMGSWQNFYVYGAMLALNGFCSGVMYPAIYALTTIIWKEGGRTALNMTYVAINVGVAVGSALCGIVAELSFTWTFYGNAILYGIVLVMFIAMLRNRQESPATGAKEEIYTIEPIEPVPVPAKRPWVTLGMLCFGLIVCWIAYVQWQTVIATYMSSLGISLSSYSMLWTINGLLILVGQPLTKWLIRFASDVKQQIVLGSIIFACSMLLLTQTTSYTGFLAGMIIMTLGEMLVWPGVPTIAARLAPPGKEGQFQGMVSGASSAGRMVGPALGAVLFESFSASVLFLAMALLCLLGAVCFYSHDRLRRRTSENGNSIQAKTESF
ncbi:MDR family MFS transporter [Brevibacillus fulvus]|uniref:MFS family arabinose efflux permease n=1 Tax=Brevibacillus fulvus TaxID=1125967 RepID=A0A939BVK6_9BACL|nr:MFS transporter [Brevibacillus fulvus]MBM7590776.1 putative MFS family arabinose efflux permease [Brevibacillus fulvus]